MASVLHLLAPDLPTGTNRQLRYLVEGMRAADWTVDVCSLESNHPRKQRQQRFLPEVEWCQHSLLNDPTIVIRCARYLRAKQPDIVHCWGKHQQAFLRLALRLAGRSRVVWSVRSEAERERIVRSRSPRTLVVNAQHLEQSIPSLHRIETIRNGLRRGEQANVVTPLHQELGIAIRFQLLSCDGRFSPQEKT